MRRERKGEEKNNINFIGRNNMQRRWYNSPTFAYIAVYGKEPDFWLRGRTEAPKKIWRGIEVDAHLKDKWLEELNSIPEIEIRASDEGKNEIRVPFVVFRFSNPKNDYRAKKVSKILNSMTNIYSKCDIGAENRPRIVVAGKTWYGKSDWEEWWDKLAGKIKNALVEQNNQFGNPSKSSWLGWSITGAIVIGLMISLLRRKK